MNRASAPRYDLFKTIVAVVLIVILLLMLLRGCATSPVAPIPTGTPPVQNPTQSLPATSAVTETVPVATNSPTSTPLPEPTTVATLTSTPTTVTAPDTPVSSTAAATETATPVPDQATPTQAPDNTSCNTPAPSRLSVGQAAVVIRRLNMRSEASILAPILQTNPTNTRVQVIGGPVCTPVGASAYLWWQIRSPTGAEGWSAELPLNSANYFLEPAPQ